MIRQRSSRGLRAILIAFLATIVTASATPAGASGIFTVAGNAVDVTAATALQARERALADAQQAAARKLMERLVVPAGGTPPRLSAAQAANLVQDVEIADEKVSPVRYIANVTVRFRPEAVRSFLRDQGVRFVERETGPILVLPVLDLPEGPVLFDDRNRWLRAWADRPQGGTVPLVVPLGDLGDIGGLSAAQALAGDRARIEALARRYGADEVVVMRATPAAAGTLGVTVTWAGDGAPRTSRASYPDPDGTMAGAVRAAAAALERPTAPAGGPIAAPIMGEAGSAYASAQITSVEEWVALRRRIAETPGVERVDVVALAPGRARLLIHHRMGIERLQQAMSQLGIQVDAGGDPVPTSPIPTSSVPTRQAAPGAVPIPLR